MLLEWNGREYPISASGLRIGRSRSNEVVLTDSEVSRHHAFIWESNGMVYIRDEGSRNGTFVNGSRITDITALRAGDQIRLGSTLLQVRVGEAHSLVSVEPTQLAPRHSSLAASRQSVNVPSVYYPVEYNPEGYAEQSLVAGERIVLKARLHWGILVWPCLNVIFGLVLIALSPIAGQMAGGSEVGGTVSLGMLVCVALPFTLGGLVGLLNAFLILITTEFAVTNKRIIAKVGVVSRHSLELFLNQVEAIMVEQTVMGRIMNYGTVVVHGTGGTKQGFPSIANPFELRRQVTTQIAKKMD
jgi:hypothetical protein